jgi:uncharacterized protein YhfF
MGREESGYVGAIAAKNAFDLKLKRALLESLGIPTKVDSDFADQLYGMSNLPFMAEDGPDPFTIKVPAGKREEALRLLAEYAQAGAAPPSRIVIMDWKHWAYAAPGGIPTECAELDMADFRYLGAAEAEGETWDFYITEKDCRELSGLGPGRFEPIAPLLNAHPGLAVAYFKVVIGHDAPRTRLFEVFGFGDTPSLAAKLGKLVMEGKKTATSSLLRDFLERGENPPEAGAESVVVDGRGRPLCLIETTVVEILPFDSVGGEFARDEGEGDLSLAYWRKAHRRHFGLGEGPADGAERVVCERFRITRRFDA